MRILIVCPRLCHGGAERVAVSLANGFVGRNHEVLFFSDLFEEQTYVLDPAVKIEALVSVSSPKIKKWWGAIWILRKYIKRNKPDVIIGIMSLCSIIAYIASLGYGVPVIATDHDSYEKPNPVKLSLFERLYKFHINKLFKVITVLTNADIEILGDKRRNVVVMPNPLLFEGISTIPPKKNVILAAGRVDNWYVKGFDLLIRAFGKLNESSKVMESRSTFNSNDIAFKIESEGWKLVIAGVWRRSETKKFLDRIAEECGILGKIEYTGFVVDMQSLYQESSIFVLSSRYEGFGLVLIEAMSQGCACIACDYKGRQREIIAPNDGKCQDSSLKFQDSSVDGQEESEDTYVSNSKISQKQETAEGPQTRNLKPETRNISVEACETGILCEPDNVDALAEAMAKMIMDDDYRGSVRQIAIERSEYYSIENTMERWESLLKQVTDTH